MKEKSSLPRKSLSCVLIKPAGPDCNLACRYCFYLKKSRQFGETGIHCMSDDILNNTLQQLMGQGADNISIAWQGGEPTLMGLDFYRKALAYQEIFGNDKKISNSLQTNGIFINKRWAEFLKENNFLVGLSIDGTRHIHNRYRRDRNGNGSWEKVVRTAKLLLENQVAVNALIAVTNYSVQFPDEIYNSLKKIGFRYMQFIPIVEFSKNGTKVKPFSVHPEDYGVFLCRLFDRWINDLYSGESKIYIRYFESIFYRYVDLTPPDCIFGEECGPYIVIEHNGNVYSCDFFVEQKWKLGNVLNDQMIDMLNSHKQQKFGAQKADLPDICHTCEWLPYCYGGCIKNRRYDHSTEHSNGLNYLCKSTKIFLTHAHSQLQTLARDWKQSNSLFQRNTLKELVQD